MFRCIETMRGDRLVVVVCDYAVLGRFRGHRRGFFILTNCCFYFKANKMQTINPQTELERDLLAALAELLIENRKLRLIIEAHEEVKRNNAAQAAQAARSRIDDIKKEALRTAYDVINCSTEQCSTFAPQGFTSSNAFAMGKI